MSKIITSNNKGIIYYFSGTGNSLFVANKYAELFSNKNIEIQTKDILDLKTISSQSKYDFVGVVFPVYAWLPPQKVIDFVNRLPSVSNKKAIIFCTCYQNSGGSLKYLQKKLTLKNYDVCYTQEYIMPQNFFSKKQNLENIKKTINNTENKIKEDFSNLLLGKKRFVKKSFLVCFLSLITSFVFFRFFLSNKKQWTVDYNKCTFCGLCEQICPTNNIVVKKKKKKVNYSNKCLFCTRCYNFCPVNAIKHTKIKEQSIQYKHFKKYFIK
jgi:NAD-dependent dihydropyrimidine dehydrogenase PreA subunit